MDSLTTYEMEQPWVIYHYGATHDKWWPLWTSTRLLGHAKIECQCASCGHRRVLKIKMPRFGKIPDNGKHPLRIRFLLDHLHCGDRPVMSWAKPLLNPQAHKHGIDLDALAMRLQADLMTAERERG